ncbi:hypothetical protein COB57_03190 [Candidatus Peregrinibacteria bacterium]|nr:MAG: hypothetical protein COB57_03190 [Candidatus Peregrinibacteria bacterium]
MHISRIQYDKIKKYMHDNKIIILKGARQTGKTTIMNKLLKELESEEKKCFFFFADDLFHENIFKNTKVFIDHLILKYKWNKTEKIYLFIDEFQYIKNAGVFLKNLYDQYHDHIKIIVSGSSSLEITKNTEFLTGRFWELNIPRINFFEFFNAEKQNIPHLSLEDTDNIQTYYDTFQTDLESSFSLFLQYGGYPELLSLPSEELKKEALHHIISNYIEKDIIFLLRVGNIQLFRKLIFILCYNPGQTINIKELSNTLAASQDTIKKYLNILEGTYIAKRIFPFSNNARKSISRMQKAYILDSGIINLFKNTLSLPQEGNNLGPLVENAVCLDLLTRTKELYYYRTLAGAEVDFILPNQSGTYDLIEVKYRNKTKNTHSAFQSFIRENPTHQIRYKILITKNELQLSGDILKIPACLFPFINMK